jgi:hypothetical protein
MLRLVAAHYQPNERERAVIIRTSLNRSIIVEIANGEHLNDFFRKVHAALHPDRLVVGSVFCVQLPKSSDTWTIRIPAVRIPAVLPETYAAEHSSHPGLLFGVGHLREILGHHVDAKLSLTVGPQAPPLLAPIATHPPGAWSRPYAPPMPQLTTCIPQGITVTRLPGLRATGVRGLAGSGLMIPPATMGRDPRLAAAACSSGEEVARRGLRCVWTRQVVSPCALCH